jgi:hypothetical protein
MNKHHASIQRTPFGDVDGRNRRFRVCGGAPEAGWSLRRIAMLRPHASWFGRILVLTLGLWSFAAQGQDFHYRYVSLGEAELPSGFNFFDPRAINNGSRIYGTAWNDSFLPHVAVYARGAVTVLQPGFFSTVNERGTIGGSVLVDPVDFIEQAALFHRDQVELIAPQAQEFTSFVSALNDSGMALVTSYDVFFQPTFVLYRNGQTKALDFGPTVTNPFGLAINNQGIVSGTQGTFDGTTAFRFDTRTGETTLLDPLSTEPDAWGVDVNNRGDVLGYSFVSGGIERIGVWDRDGVFQSYFVEGVPEFPTISNHLLFNDNNLVVITNVSSPTSERANSYLVPKPGVRLNLADLVENLPAGQNLRFITDINNHGDMIGSSVEDFVLQDFFLLERSGVGDR